MTQCFWEGEIFFFSSLSLEAIDQSSGSSFLDFFVKTFSTAKLTTLLEPLHRDYQIQRLLNFWKFLALESEKSNEYNISGISEKSPRGNLL